MIESREVTRQLDIYKAFGMEMVIYVILMAVFFVNLRPGKHCGVPVAGWLIVHLSLFFFNTFLKLSAAAFSQQKTRCTYRLISTWLSQIILIAWLLYGNFLVFLPEATDCRSNPDTVNLFLLMTCLLVVGYVQMIHGFLVVFVLPYVIHCLSKSRETSNEQARGSISSSTSQPNES